jgi:hypothetical protein
MNKPETNLYFYGSILLQVQKLKVIVVMTFAKNENVSVINENVLKIEI